MCCYIWFLASELNDRLLFEKKKGFNKYEVHSKNSVGEFQHMHT